MEPYLVFAWILGGIAAAVGLFVVVAGVVENDRDVSRIGLALLAGSILAPVVLAVGIPGVLIFCIAKAVAVADLPALLPGPKEQSPGQLSIANKHGGQISEVRDGTS